MRFDLVIIGAGISGLTAALAAEQRGIERVLLVEHQKRIGGFTRIYMDSPEFAAERDLVEKASHLSYPVWLQSTVIGLFARAQEGWHELYIQTPAATETVQAKKVLIASGAMEKPREAHKIAGTRPAGVMTPALACELLERGLVPGRNLIVYVNGRCASGAVRRLLASQASVAVVNGADGDIVEIQGRARVERIFVKNRTGEGTTARECDGLIFAKGRYPSTFFLKGTPVERNDAMEIAVDEVGRTAVPGIFAAGSCTSRGDDEHRLSAELSRTAVQAIFEEMV